MGKTTRVLTLAAIAAAAGGVAWALRDLPAQLGAVAAGARAERMRRSPQYGEDRFVNPVPREVLPDGAMAAAFRELIFGQQPRRPKGVIPVVKPAFPAKQDGDLHVTWLGHASALVEIEGVRVLFDPVWSDRCSPSPLVGPKRLHPCRGALAGAAADRRGRDLARPLRPPRHGHRSGRWPDAARRRSWCRWASARTWSAGACPPDRIVELDWDERCDGRGTSR